MADYQGKDIVNYYPQDMGGYNPASNWNPVKARSDMDKYFRTYYGQQSEREAKIEELQTKRREKRDEWAWKTGENEKDREHKAKLAAMKRDWETEDADEKDEFAWVGALTQLSTNVMGWDALYNQSMVRKDITAGIQESLAKLQGVGQYTKAELAKVMKKSSGIIPDFGA